MALPTGQARRQPTCPPPQTSRLSICDVLAEVRNVSSQQKRIKEIESPSRSAWITRPPAVHTNCINCQNWQSAYHRWNWCSDHLLIISDISRLFRISLASRHPFLIFLSFPTSASTVSAATLRMASNTCRWMPLGPTEGDGSGDPEARSWCNWPQLMTHSKLKIVENCRKLHIEAAGLLRELFGGKRRWTNEANKVQNARLTGLSDVDVFFGNISKRSNLDAKRQTIGRPTLWRSIWSKPLPEICSCLKFAIWIRLKHVSSVTKLSTIWNCAFSWKGISTTPKGRALLGIWFPVLSNSAGASCLLS